MDKTFVAVAEDRPGAAWQRRFARAGPPVKPWYLKEGLAARPTPAEARAALAAHMPELVPVYETLCALAGPDAVAHRMLGNYARPPVIGGCSQAVWTGPGGPALVRNTLETLSAGMLRPPLYALDAARGFATVNTAVYRPVEAAVEYVWPGHAWRQALDRFEPGADRHVYAVADRVHSPLAV